MSVGPNTNPNGLALDSSGNVYTVAVEGQPRVIKLSPSGDPVPFSATASYIAGNNLTGPGGGTFGILPWFGAFLAVDRSGGAADSCGPVYGGYPLTRYPASQFDLPSPVGTVIEPDTSVPRLGVDPVSDHLLVDRGHELLERDTTGAAVGSPFGSTTGSAGIAGDGSGNVLAADAGGGIFVYGSGEVQLPTATTGEASEVGTSTAKVEGSVDPDSAGGIVGCEFRFGEDSGYSDGSAPCVPAASPGTPIASPTSVTANLTGLVSGTTYRYRLFVTNANGTNVGGERTLTTSQAIEGVSTGAASDVTKESATLHGSFVGDGSDTHYYFEWGASVDYGNKTPAPPGNDAGSTAGQQEVDPVALGGLQGGTTYHYRLVAVDADGTSRGQDESFTTAPAVTNLTADPPTALTGASAGHNRSFDADSHEVHYYFEWGETTSYGNTTPLPPGNSVAPGSGRVEVPSVTVSGLTEGGIYHYRIVASSSIGTTYSADATFKAAEPPIVNNIFKIGRAHV